MKKLVALLVTTLATSFTLTAATQFAAAWDGVFSASSQGASESISINFHNGSELSGNGSAMIGLAGYQVSKDGWNSLVATNNASLMQLKGMRSGGGVTEYTDMSVTITGTRGHWNCSKLSSGDNILHGYIDDNASYPTPTVTVTGIPYDKYRVVIYHSTDTASVPFGYDLVNGIPFTGVSGHTVIGTVLWGNSGPKDSANSLEEGVNALVTPILHNNAEAMLTVTGHRVSGVTRGCIAAIQIFDATDETDDFSNTTNRVSSTYASGVWSFPDDITAADPVNFGGMIIGTNAVSQSLGSSSASTISATVLAEIPETAVGTLISLGVQDGHSVHARYNGNGTFGLSYDTAGAVVTTAPIDVAGSHIWTLTFDTSNGAAFCKDGVKVIETSSIKWTYPSVKKITGSVEFGAKHDQSDPLTGAIIYAARTDFLNAQASNAGDVVSSGYAEQEIPGVSGLATLAEKVELFTHLAAYGDTEGLLALMPHRTSTYAHNAWHSPLDAELADGDYVDGLTTVFNPVVQKLPGVSTNAAAASVLAQIPQTASGVIANITVVNGSSTHCVFARANGDGTVSLGWENGTKRTTSGSLGGWDSIHVWTLVSHDSQGCKLYRDGELVLEDSDLKFNGYKAGASIMFGNATNSKHPLAGMNVYAVHTDFGSSSAIFDTAAESAASVFDSFDFMEELAGRPIDEKLAAFERYCETGETADPETVFDPETDEKADECVLRISEIMPKPTDAQNRGKLEGMDVNGLESGWVEVENTSDKWADLADYRFIRVNRGKKTDPAGVGNFPSRLVPPHSRAIFYTSERYSNSKEQAVSAFEHGTFDGKPMIMGEELHNILVWGDKVNPKKSPYVRLYYAPGGDSDSGTVVDTVVVPSDLPEGWSIIVGEAAEGEGTRRWMCPTPTRGRANTATDGLKRIGPNVGPLYEKKGQKKTELVSEFAVPTPPAKPGEDYVVTLPINGVMNPDGTFTPRAADQIASIKFVFRKDLDDSTLTTNDVDIAGKTTDANWGDQYTATIPSAFFPAAGHLMQWKVLITDGEGVEWTSPSFNNPDDGYEWYGTIVEPDYATQMSATLPTWHMFVDEASKSQMDYDKDDKRYTLANGARVAIYDSSTSNYYDYVRIDLRGNTSAGFTKKGHGLRFAKAHPLTMTDVVTGETIEEIRKTSLISEFADPSYMRQMIAFWLWRKMGNLVPFDFPVRCNLNGEFYQLAFNSERFTDELIEDVYGLDKFGYGYKNVGTMKSGSSTTAGSIEKKTPDDEDETNITVLQNELRAKITAAQQVSSTPDGGDTGLDNVELTKFVVEKFDLPAWLNYLASARITQEMDDVWANVCAYYDNPSMKEGERGTGTWMPLGYDFNLTFGQHYLDGGMSASGLKAQDDWFKCHPFYGGNRVRCYSSSAMSSMINNGNDGFEAVWQSAKFRRLYLRRLRTLMDQELKAPGTATNDTPFMVKMYEMADLMRTDATQDAEKWGNDNTDKAIDVWGGNRPADMDAGIQDIWDNYVVPRREHLFVTHSATNTAKAIGYGSNLNAGIPEAQSPIDELKVGFLVDNTADETMTSISDTEKVVIRNSNNEAVDMSGWQLSGRFEMTLPAGTVVDANDTITVVVDRRAYVAEHEAELTDQVIIGNATLKADSATLLLNDADGVKVLQVAPPSDESQYLRLNSFDGIPPLPSDGDTDEWIALTNISETATLDLSGVRVVFLKAGDAVAKCDFNIREGLLAPLGSVTLHQADYSKAGWTKITNGELAISIYDANGLVAHSGGVVQKNHKKYRGEGGPGGNFFIRLKHVDATFSSGDFEEVEYPSTSIGVVPGTDVMLEAATQEEADAALANCEIVLSDEDTKWLDASVLKLVAVPVVSVDSSTGVETTTFVAQVAVDETKVDAPVIAEAATEGDKPVEVEADEDGKTVVKTSISNAFTGLWYGYEVANELGGENGFTNDVQSFERATNTTHKVTSSLREGNSGFFRVKVLPVHP